MALNTLCKGVTVPTYFCSAAKYELWCADGRAPVDFHCELSAPLPTLAPFDFGPTAEFWSDFVPEQDANGASGNEDEDKDENKDDEKFFIDTITVETEEVLIIRYRSFFSILAKNNYYEVCLFVCGVLIPWIIMMILGLCFKEYEYLNKYFRYLVCGNKCDRKKLNNHAQNDIIELSLVTMVDKDGKTILNVV